MADGGEGESQEVFFFFSVAYIKGCAHGDGCEGVILFCLKVSNTISKTESHKLLSQPKHLPCPPDSKNQRSL